MAALLSLTCVVSPKPSLPVPSQRSNARWRWESVASRVASQPERRRSRVVALVSRASRVVFRDLDADDFRHPLDKQLPGLHKLMIEAAKVLDTEAPDLYVRQNPVPNAYTLAISGRKPFIVVHTSLVELLTRRELQVSSSLFCGVETLEYI
ncbi:hypothetical protein BHE74_00033452 [Ensete ventricosum]|nr:hypothetical protein BHE74_00033452 [Ensete ventricosum]